MTDHKLPLRAKVATSVSQTAAALSRAAGRGDGSVIGGWHRPDDRPRPARPPRRRPADRAGLRHQRQDHHDPAHRRRDGRARRRRHQLASAPTCRPATPRRWPGPAHTPYAVLEVDEHYLRQVSTRPSPHVVALLNLSRDQLDRAKEVAMMAALWRDALRRPRHRTSSPTPTTRWWSGPPAASRRTSPGSPPGQRWHDDSWVCPECGCAPSSACRRATGAAPAATCAGRLRSGRVDAATAVVDPDGRRHPVTLQLPGRVNRANAATALAVAAQFGVRAGRRRRRGWPQVASIAGRYATVERDGRTIRLLLAKNPAGWLEAFDMAERRADPAVHQRPRPRRPRHLLALRRRLLPAARPPGAHHRRPGDGPGRPAGGQRGRRSSTSRRSRRALAAVPPGRLEVIANYTAFQDIRAELDRVN